MTPAPESPGDIVKLECPLCPVFTWGLRSWRPRYEAACRYLHAEHGEGEAAHSPGHYQKEQTDAHT